MKKLTLLTLTAASLLSLTPAAQAANILYYRDGVIGDDQITAALADLSGTHTTTFVTSSSDFTSMIASGSYQLGIVSIQNYSPDSAAVNALATFTSGGGFGIYSDWSQNSGLAGNFGVGFDLSVNHASMTVTDTNLSAGLSGPISFTNPGWGVYSTGLTGGVSAGTFNDGSSAIAFGNNTYVNGFTNDAFTNPAEGKQFYKNQITHLLNSPSNPGQKVPDAGSTVALLGASVLGLGYARRKFARK